MKVTIALTDREPPVGTVQVNGSQPIEFAGWLGLLSVLGDVVDGEDSGDVTGSALHAAPEDAAPDDDVSPN